MPERLELAAGAWQRVSPRYVVVVTVQSALLGLGLLVAAGWAWLSADAWWGVVFAVVAVAITVPLLVFVRRRTRAIGYRLRDDDLLFRRGILFERFVAVPYGRMQLVDINRGPLARMLGLSDLTFVTAAASTKVAVPGLPAADAETLRDRLVELAESRRTGL